MTDTPLVLSNECVFNVHKYVLCHLCDHITMVLCPINDLGQTYVNVSGMKWLENGNSVSRPTRTTSLNIFAIKPECETRIERIAEQKTRKNVSERTK